MAGEHHTFTPEAARRIVRAVLKSEKDGRDRRGRRRQWPVGSGGSCKGQNAIIDVTVLGGPTGGELALVLILEVAAEILIPFDASPAEVVTALVTHPDVAEGDVMVSGGPLPDATIRIEFSGNLAKTAVPVPTSDWSGLTGGTGMGVICALAQRGAE